MLSGAEQLVFSTDSFVVSPWRFPGGDIGELSVCGTVNDLCMAGGQPRYLSLSFILEEGFPFSDLEQIVTSIAREAKEAGVSIVTGDTKVVESGKGDGIYINTAGIGFRRAVFPGQSGIRPYSGRFSPLYAAISRTAAVCRSYRTNKGYYTHRFTKFQVLLC